MSRKLLILFYFKTIIKKIRMQWNLIYVNDIWRIDSRSSDFVIEFWAWLKSFRQVTSQSRDLCYSFRFILYGELDTIKEESI